MNTDLIGRHEVLSPIYHKKLQFPRKEVQSSYERRKGKFAFNRLILTSLLCSKLLPLFMGKNSPFWRNDWLIVLNYNFECDRLINLSDNKLSDNNLAIELVENRSIFNQSQAKKWYIYIFIMLWIVLWELIYKKEKKYNQIKQRSKLILKMQLCLLLSQLRYTNDLSVYRSVYSRVRVAKSIIFVEVGCFLFIENRYAYSWTANPSLSKA